MVCSEVRRSLTCSDNSQLWPESNLRSLSIPILGRQDLFYFVVKFARKRSPFFLLSREQLQ